MEIKVKDLGLVEEKSTAEIEEQLLKKHEEKFEDQPVKQDVAEKVELKAEKQTTEPK